MSMRVSHRQLLSLAAPHEKLTQRQLAKEYRKLGNEMLRVMRSMPPSQALAGIAALESGHSQRLSEILRKNITRTMRDFAKEQLQSLGVPEGGDIGRAVIRAVTMRADAMARAEVAKVASRTGTWLTKGAQTWADDGRDKAAAYIRERFMGGMADRRSRTIGSQTILQAASEATDEAAKTLAEIGGGKVWKQWQARKDSKVRRCHAHADGQTVLFNQTFLVCNPDGKREEMRYPRDPAGSPGNTINCRCMVKWYRRKPKSAKPRPVLEN